MSIVIVDYKMGNLGSIANILKKIGVPSAVSSDPEVIRKAEKLILPGVGSFDNGMKNIREMGLEAPLNKQVIERGIPVLGICLGMQLLTARSEEGELTGLNWIPGRTIKFNLTNSDLRIPHMGWNTVESSQNHMLFENMPSKPPRFYFVHSYYVHCEAQEHAIGSTRHGISFTSAVQRGNIFGVQFHPEKSHKFGMALLGNFSRYQA